MKDKHQYDLNPKVIKFFLAEMLKDQRNRNKLCMINQKIDNLSKDRVLKFGMQQYFNVMDEIVDLFEDTIRVEKGEPLSFTKSTVYNERSETKHDTSEFTLPEPKRISKPEKKINRTSIKKKITENRKKNKSEKNTVTIPS